MAASPAEPKNFVGHEAVLLSTIISKQNPVFCSRVGRANLDGHVDVAPFITQRLTPFRLIAVVIWPLGRARDRLEREVPKVHAADRDNKGRGQEMAASSHRAPEEAGQPLPPKPLAMWKDRSVRDRRAPPLA